MLSVFRFEAVNLANTLLPKESQAGKDLLPKIVVRQRRVEVGEAFSLDYSATKFWYLESGVVKHIPRRGSDRVNKILYPSDIMQQRFVDGGEGSLTYQAIKPALVTKINVQLFLSMIRDNHIIKSFFFDGLSRDLLREEILRRNLKLTEGLDRFEHYMRYAIEKCCRIKHDLPLEFPVGTQDLSELLSLKHEEVSRGFAQLTERQILQAMGSRYIIAETNSIASNSR